MGLNRNDQGAPFGNQNGRKRGFYSAVLEDDEIADLTELVDNQDLSGEIGLIPRWPGASRATSTTVARN
jgi:hypothetical protein